MVYFIGLEKPQWGEVNTYIDSDNSCFESGLNFQHAFLFINFPRNASKASITLACCWLKVYALLFLYRKVNIAHHVFWLVNSKAISMILKEILNCCFIAFIFYFVSF